MDSAAHAGPVLKVFNSTTGLQKEELASVGGKADAPFTSIGPPCHRGAAAHSHDLPSGAGVPLPSR
jgi:hypothetical protein